MQSIGDMAQLFLARRNTSQIKSEMTALTQELSTGQVRDLARHLGNDTSRLMSVDRSLMLLDAYDVATSETDQMLGAMQSGLTYIDEQRSSLGERLILLTNSGDTTDLDAAATDAKTTFENIVQSLNTRFANRSLFAGAATGGNALAAAEDILADFQASLAGLTDVDEILAAADTWFNDPTGGYATQSYLGDSGSQMTRRIDADHSIAITARADGSEFRQVLKAAALAAVAPTLGLSDSDAEAIMIHGGEVLVDASQDIATLAGQLGTAQEQVQDVVASHAAQRTSLTVLRSDLVTADSYDTATALQQIQTQLELHFTLTARLSALSLAEYL